MMQAQSHTECPECQGHLVTEDNETLCAECGLIVAESTIDHGPEWRSFADDTTDRRRTGAPLTRSRHDRGLSTEIGNDTNLRLTGRKRRQLARMRREHSRAKIATKADRNKVYAFTEIRRLVSTLELPRSVRESACALFDSAQSADLLRGRSLEGFAAAAVYTTCRVQSIARTVDEIADHARADVAELRAAYAALNRELGVPTGPISPSEYIPRFASELSVPEAVTAEALTLAAEAEDRGLVVGRDPTGVAAGCLYTAACQLDFDISQTTIAEVADVSPVTLRKTYHDFR